MAILGGGVSLQVGERWSKLCLDLDRGWYTVDICLLRLGVFLETHWTLVNDTEYTLIM